MNRTALTLDAADSPRAVCRSHSALRLLADARAAALELGLDPWEFAVGVPELFAAGLTGTDVRLLVARGLAEHAREVIRPARGRRRFRPAAAYALTQHSCFTITDDGLRGLDPSSTPGTGPGPAAPRWDGQWRQLWYGDTLVKWFRVRAASQETILAAFEEDGWPPRIDDPLQRVLGMDPQARLREAVKGLNRGQRAPLLSFRCDGTGEGVVWGPRGEE